jgi:hypothetical protein
VCLQGSSVSDAVEWALSPASGLPATTQDHLRVALGLKAEGYTGEGGFNWFLLVGCCFSLLV